MGSSIFAVPVATSLSYIINTTYVYTFAGAMV